MTIFEIIKNETGKPRYEIEKMILEAAGRIIRYSDDEGLKAIAGSTSAQGNLWGARSMAATEMKRRNINQEN